MDSKAEAVLSLCSLSSSILFLPKDAMAISIAEIYPEIKMRIKAVKIFNNIILFFN